MMYQTALLLLTGPLKTVVESFGMYLKCANQRVTNCLYVKLEPELCRPFSKSDTVSLGRLATVVPILYNKASSICKNVDVRVLLTNINQSKIGYNKTLCFDVILTNCEAEDSINKYLENNFDSRCYNIIKLDCVDDVIIGENSYNKSSEFEVCRTVCLGGTFDRVHNGHKVLLTEGILRASEKLIVGVSDGTMIQRKVLWELIEPIEKRIEEVLKFLLEVDPSLHYKVVPITNPFGPTITEEDIDCIVVTTETRVGGEKVNIERGKKGMNQLKMHIVDLVENSDHNADEEDKLSSSTKRMRLLGTPLKISQNFSHHNKPYCILLRGHLVSGKSDIADRFQTLGIPVLCCDNILQTALYVDSNLSRDFMRTFSISGALDWKKISVLCLKNKEMKDWIVENVFPRIKTTLQQDMQVYSNYGAHTILVKESSLLEFQDLGIDINEVWAAILPSSECIKNLKEQFNLSEDEAVETANFLPVNGVYVDAANILFCNKWSSEGTQEQVARASSYLKGLQGSK